MTEQRCIVVLRSLAGNPHSFACTPRSEPFSHGPSVCCSMILECGGESSHLLPQSLCRATGMSGLAEHPPGGWGQLRISLPDGMQARTEGILTLFSTMVLVTRSEHS